MPHPAAPLLAADLGRLERTNSKGERGWVQLPGFMSTAGMGDEQAAQHGLLALAVSEAILETLESKHGYQVLSKDQIAAKINAATTALTAPPEKTTLRCKRCNGAVLNVRVDDNRVDVGLLSAALGAHAEVCR